MGIQDRDSAPDVLKSVASRDLMLRHIFADGGSAGPKLGNALKAIGRWTVQIVKRCNTAMALKSCPTDGLSSVSMPGWGDAACQKIGKNPSPAQKRRSPSPTFEESCDISQKVDNSQIVSNQTLRSIVSPRVV